MYNIKMKFTVENLFEEFEIEDEVYSGADRAMLTTSSQQAIFEKEVASSYENAYSRTVQSCLFSMDQSNLSTSRCQYSEDLDWGRSSIGQNQIILKNDDETHGESKREIDLQERILQTSMQAISEENDEEEDDKEKKGDSSKNFLSLMKRIFVKSIQKKQWLTRNKTFVKFKNSNPSLKKFELLFRQEELRPTIAGMLRDKIIYREIQTSRAHLKQKCTYLIWIPSLKKAFLQKRYPSIK